MKVQTSKKKISTTVLISMTDVIFLLLIFLLIASNFSSQTGIPVKLPGSTSSSRQTHQVLNLVYAGGETVNFNGNNIAIEQLQKILKPEYKSREQVVRLSAQKTAELQNVIRVMDAIRGAGFEKIFVATETIRTK
ncbi:MAG TPA: biopolymer transporter ExbD [Candidatus Cloacimonadota bacterium]|nr:biopolymer transporter ExbD [Candidatus Cloacimonadota bacterium]